MLPKLVSYDHYTGAAVSPNQGERNFIRSAVQIDDEFDASTDVCRSSRSAMGGHADDDQWRCNIGKSHCDRRIPALGRNYTRTTKACDDPVAISIDARQVDSKPFTRVVTSNGSLKCFFAKARPEPDFKYCSKRTAAPSVANSSVTTNCHGRSSQVCREAPELCDSSRWARFDVMPT